MHEPQVRADFLIEREKPLELLGGSLARAAKGRGHSIFIAGEAGIGKSALVNSFVRSCTQRVRLLWGACDALATPRPLGPLYDMAHESGGRLLQALEVEQPPHRLFQVFIDEVRAEPRPTVIVVEDGHWADDASADFLKFIARRIARLPALLVMTYRDDEVPMTHPLMRAIADIPSDNVTPIRLHGLSPVGVRRLSESYAKDLPNLHAITNGNPLLATELLRGHAEEVSATLRDTMFTRLRRLSPAARDIAEFVSVIPDRTECRLIGSACIDDSKWLRECVDGRVLVADQDYVRFRHELTRQVVEESLPGPRRRQLHAQVMRALEDEVGEARALSRLVHHADGAGDAAAVLRLAPLAGAEASRRGAHRQGAAYYRIALSYAGDAAAREQATLLEKLACEAALSGDVQAALDANARAFRIWQEGQDTLAQGINRRRRFEMLHVGVFRRGDAEFTDLAEAAVHMLGPHCDSGEFARACMNLAFVLSMRGCGEEAQAMHDRAIVVAEAAADPIALGYVLLQGELRRHSFHAAPGLDPAQRALRLALDHNDDQLAGQAYFALAMFTVNTSLFDVAERTIAEGLLFSEERDLDGQKFPLLAMQARVALMRGDPKAAESTAKGLLVRVDLPGIAEFNASLVAGVCQSRRGSPEAWATLKRALDVSSTKLRSQLSQVHALSALAELHWLQRDTENALKFACRAELASRTMLDYPLIRERTVFDIWRIGGVMPPQQHCVSPYGMQVVGDWAGAAAAWESLGCPFERAVALIEGDAAASREAFGILERLDATAVLVRYREALVRRGVARIPRGPRPSTRAHPMGLTSREAEVLALLAQGLRNQEIGGRLHRSTKTVSHHVAAILAKLGARTRHNAIEIAYARGLLRRSH